MFALINRFFLSFFFILPLAATSQIVTTSPSFPTADQTLTITYDATQGSGQLAGLPMGEKMYGHFGIFTDPGEPGIWMFVVGNWGMVDSRVEMTRLGSSDLWEFSFTPSLFEWFNGYNNNSIPGSTKILNLAMVFRNADGTLEGKTETLGDIILPIFDSDDALIVQFDSPSNDLFVDKDSSIEVKVKCSANAELTLLDNGQVLTTEQSDSLVYLITATTGNVHEVIITADDGNLMVADTFFYYIRPDQVVIEALPAGVEPGIHYTSSSSVILSLYAPNKDFGYVVGDFSDWRPGDETLMKLTPDSNIYWVEITDLIPGKYYSFQYWIDGDIRIGDPYSPTILDPDHDGEIGPELFPDLPAYPRGKTYGMATLFRMGGEPFTWQVSNFEKPEKENLVIYELLIRDFIESHDYLTLIDTLPYLKELGVNAIELMPVSEFEGNRSWGYNPSYHLALDKYYGSPQAFKSFVDACHAEGIAVIIDIVLNHAFSKSPLFQLYYDSELARPTPENPWLNEFPKHDFNVGYDFNHDSEQTRYFMYRVLKHWIQEYRIDGFRFDLSKGLTQNATGPWDAGAFDGSRIFNITRMADTIWQVDSTFIIILEHFTDWNEERALAFYGQGMMVWDGFTTHNEFLEAGMGYSSNLLFADYHIRSFSKPRLVNYIESHDEERLLFKTTSYGLEEGDYNIKEVSTGLERAALCANFFIPLPGPKMIWQFGELGYGYSINYCPDGTIDDACRTADKPIRWDYLDDPDRLTLYEVYKNLNHLKLTYPVFQTEDFTFDAVNDDVKRLFLNHPDMNVVILGVFSAVVEEVVPEFQHDGWWYEFYTGDSLFVADPMQPLIMEHGEYRLYTDVNIGRAEFTFPPEKNSPTIGVKDKLWIYPNPAREQITIQFPLDAISGGDLRILDSQGRLILSQKVDSLQNYELKLTFSANQWSPGVYVVEYENDTKTFLGRLVIQ